MEKYIPKEIEKGYGLMLVELKECPLCGKRMISLAHPSPVYRQINFNVQIALAGWVERGCRDRGLNEYICIECEKAGKASYACALCQQQRKSSEIERSFGDPAEHLCKLCYSNVSARVWNEKVAQLNEVHRWDYE